MNHLLFVDDDVHVARSFQRLFPAPDFQVDIAADGARALALLERHDYDVIVADYQMPFMTGAELLAAVRERRPELMRILVTGGADFTNAIEAINRGEVFRLVRKPWDEQELRFAVRLAVDMRQLGRDRKALEQELVERGAALEHAHEKLSRLNQDLETIIHRRTGNLLDALSAALDVRDNETELHSRRVSKYAARLAVELGLDETAVRVVEQGALLHDVGKIAIPDSILLKPGPLDEEEWAVMRRHPIIGRELLRSIDFLEGAREIIVQHQERWDGSGYPTGLRGDAICIGARIFSCVDTYDAITSDRPYRKGRSYDVARGEIERGAGTQLDPSVVAAFLRLPANTWSAIRNQVQEAAPREAA
jgi:putative nucleotidyltransferase with HDIG domain